ncbi:hypothetical protein CYMTET_23143 [Cymbomonas tetramitiformis]|uniref:PiggyBac transposable element-derived protein domain-containing protein n=1 Tax=Cymbomonas tetramitiformis TaxID=36881 RepID=A0AAE0FZA9_9CHLO|nr:hypothetical protein CYMTET_23143 [Cymbomonas tetramitiformis]
MQLFALLFVLVSAGASAALTPKDLLKRRVKTPGEVFGRKVKHKTYYGTVVKKDKVRGEPPEQCMTIRYDDGRLCWFPISTLSRWLLAPGQDERPDEDSEDLSDSPDSEEEEEPASNSGEGSAHLLKDYRVSQAFVENKPFSPGAIPFKPSKSTAEYFPPPDKYTPGLSRDLVSRKPPTAELGISYVFEKILGKNYWRTVSAYSVKYARAKKAGTDINAELAEDDRHSRYEGKGKHRPCNEQWVGPNGVLLLHCSLLLMMLNKRAAATDHFSLSTLLRSPISDIYTRDSFSQTLRYFCPYDIDKLEANTGEDYDPYLKYILISETVYVGIHSLLVPPQVASYDEGGKPYTGKGGEGITVHYNPLKPNKRMSMCFMFAAFGIPFACEFYTGQRSNKYNEKKYNSAEEVAYGKTIARFLIRLFRQAFADSEGHGLFMDNLFTSIFLFYLLRTLYKAMAVGTHRANDALPNLSWGPRFERGEYRWATATCDEVPFLYMEYGDNKMVRFLSTAHSSPEANPGKVKSRSQSETRTYEDVFLPQVKLDYYSGTGSCDLADMMESLIRLDYRFRRPHLINYAWHFETAVYSAHRTNRLLYPESYKHNVVAGTECRMRQLTAGAHCAYVT